MGLPFTPNVTVDIYRGSNPSSPIPGGASTATVQGHLRPDIAKGRYGSALYIKWTHILTLPDQTDIRDAYNTQLDPSRNNNAADTVVLTDSKGNQVPYYVVFVEEAFRGTGFAEVRAYLDRFQPATWPSDGI